jgi:hypothetical protein
MPTEGTTATASAPRDAHSIIAELRETYAGHKTTDIIDMTVGALDDILVAFEALLQGVETIQAGKEQ